MLIGTAVLALGVLAGAPDPAEGEGRPQSRVEAPAKVDPPTGRLLLSVALRGARFKVEGDLEKKVPFRLWVPLGNLIQVVIESAPAPPPRDVLPIF